MGLVFDLAEALNIGWSAASGQGVQSLKDVIKERVFRTQLVKELRSAKFSIDNPAAVRVLSSPSFLNWLEAGADSPLEDFLSDAQLRSFAVTSPQLAREIGQALRECLRSLVFRSSTWAERQLLLGSSEAVNTGREILGVVQELEAGLRLARRSTAFAGHARYVDLLRRRRGGQTVDAQDFVPPDLTHPSHPDRIWDRLSVGDGAAVLLKGAGGAGKTRLLLEVTTHADALGWQVIHVLDVGQPATDDDLIDLTLASERPVLIAMDYPNELDGVDLTQLEERLVPLARERGVPLALVGAARPGWLATRPALGPFEVVEICNTASYEQQVSQHLVRAIAPNAIAQVGADEILRLAGTRPMIATLIAREAERRALNESLLTASSGSMRSGRLTDWLRKRLDDDGYEAKRATRFADRSYASEALTVAASIACVLPNSLEVVNLHAAVAARAIGMPEPEQFARRTVVQLEAIGWVAQTDSGVVSVHDVVVDHLIEEIFEADAHNGNDSYGKAMLAGALQSLPSLHAMVGNLTRYVSDADGSSPAHPGPAQRHLATWVSQHATELENTLVHTDDLSLAARTLVAIRKSSVWAMAVAPHWESLVGRWLAAHPTGPETTLVLASLIRQTPLARREWMVKTVQAWLRDRGKTLDARSVVYALLRHSEFHRSDWAIAAIREWLDHNGAHPDARAVVGRLRRVRTPATRAWVVAAVLRWLGTNGQSPDSATVLSPWVHDGDNIDSAWLQDAVRSWLTANSDSASGASLLSRAIERTKPDDRVWLLPVVRTWLSSNARNPGAAVILARLVEGRAVFGRAVVDEIVQVWLNEHDTNPSARIVLESLLHRDDLKDQAWVDSHARSWLDVHGKTLDAGIVLGELAGRSGLRDRKWWSKIVRAWLRSNGTDIKASSLIVVLLGQGGTTDQALTFKITRRWLGIHGTKHEARSVIINLIQRSDLGGDEWAARAAELWLEGKAPELSSRAVLLSLLDRGGLDSHGWVLGVVHAWLEANRLLPDARPIICLLLRYDGPVSLPLEWLARVTTQWLVLHAARSDATYVVQAALEHQDLVGEEWVSDATARWLESHATERGAHAVLNVALEHDDLTRTYWLAVSTETWLSTFARKAIAALVIISAIRSRNLIGLGWVERSAKAWLSENSRHAFAAWIVHLLLPRHVLDGRAWILETTQAWLKENSQRPDARFVLLGLLSDPGATHSGWSVDAARAWLAGNGKLLIADAILARLLAVHDATSPPWLNQATKRWLAAHGTKPAARSVLESLASGREIAEAEWIQEAARDWLALYRHTDGARPLLQILLTRQDLAGSEWVVDATR